MTTSGLTWPRTKKLDLDYRLGGGGDYSLCLLPLSTIQMVQVVLSLNVEANYSPLFNAEIKNAWSYTHMHFHINLHGFGKKCILDQVM
jgi:hypothetical protein